MRMWGVEPNKLCRKHLLGEHVEMHMFAGTISKGISITGYILKELVNPALIQSRHDQLAEEINKRGYNHKSPLPFDCSTLPYLPVDVNRSEQELKKRCQECKI